VHQKSFSLIELSLPTSDERKLPGDDCVSLRLGPMKYQANVRQTHPDVLTRAQHSKASEMFVAVVAMARR
jgi:hypothetical protein